jgi:hypothetical protein
MIYASIQHVLQLHRFAIVNGRGAQNQNDWFHQEYVRQGRRLQVRYFTLRRNAEKRMVQLELIGWVEGQDGRFIKRLGNGTFEDMTEAEKLEKVARLLGERPRTTTIIAAPPPQLPPLEIFVVAVRRDADSVASSSASEVPSQQPLTTGIGNTQSGPTDVDSFRLPTLIDDDALSFSLSSVTSSIMEIDNSTVNTFPMVMETLDDVSLYSLHTAPLRMVTYDDDDDNLSLLSLDGK